LSYKPEFDTTNNVSEYEALILGLEVERKMKITKITTYGDSELVVQQVKSVYQTKHPIMRSYKNQAWDLIENLFDAFNIVAIPREENHRANALAIVANTFKVPINIKLRYEIKVRYRSSIPDNVRHW